MVRIAIIAEECLVDARGAPRKGAREALAALRRFEVGGGALLQLLVRPLGQGEGLEVAVQQLLPGCAAHQCAVVLPSGTPLEPLRARGLELLPLEDAPAAWPELPLRLAILMRDRGAPNVALAVAVLVGAEAVDVSVAPPEPDRIRARALRWTAIGRPGGALPADLHVRLPVAVEARIGRDGRLEAVRIAEASAEEREEAALAVGGLLARGEVAVDPERRPPGATHVLEQDGQGRRLLRRIGFSG